MAPTNVIKPYVSSQLRDLWLKKKKKKPNVNGKRVNVF